MAIGNDSNLLALSPFSSGSSFAELLIDVEEGVSRLRLFDFRHIGSEPSTIEILQH